MRNFYWIFILSLGVCACSGKKVPEGFIYPLGDLLFNKENIALGTTYVGREYTDTVMVYNPKSKAVRLEGFNNFPELTCRKIGGSVQDWRLGGYDIASGEIDTLIITFRPENEMLLGEYYNVLRFLVDGEVDYSFGVVAEAEVKENFNEWSEEEKAKAPRIEVDSLEYDFGTLKEGEEKSIIIPIRNTGSGSLLLRKIETTCGCTAVVPGQRVILPGKSTQLDVVFHSAGRIGKQRKQITLYCNDPRRPILQFIIKGEVRRANASKRFSPF